MPNPWICRTCTKALKVEERSRRRCGACEERLALQAAERARRKQEEMEERRDWEIQQTLKPRLGVTAEKKWQTRLWQAVADAYVARRKEEKDMPYLDEEALEEHAREFAARIQAFELKAARIFNKGSARLGDDAVEPDDVIQIELLDLFEETFPTAFAKAEKLDRIAANKRAKKKAANQ